MACYQKSVGSGATGPTGPAGPTGPIGPSVAYIQDLSGLFNPKVYPDTTSGATYNDGGTFSVPVSGYYHVSNKYLFTNTSAAPVANNFLYTEIQQIVPSISLAHNSILNARFETSIPLGLTTTSWSVDMTVYLTSGTSYGIYVTAKNIGTFTLTQSVLIRLY